MPALSPVSPTKRRSVNCSLMRRKQAAANRSQAEGPRRGPQRAQGPADATLAGSIGNQWYARGDWPMHTDNAGRAGAAWQQARCRVQPRALTGRGPQSEAQLFELLDDRKSEERRLWPLASCGG